MTRFDDRRRFDRAAATFDGADFVHERTREGLFARLQPMTVDARLVVDLGSATGSSARRLRKAFRRATVVAVDLSLGMLQMAARRPAWFSRAALVQADARNLPFADNSVDLVFSNLMLPWIPDRRPVFSEVARVLGENGLFAFSTLGPDSLGGRKASFSDMHDVGDELVRAGLADPVLDVDRLTVNYRDRASLERDFDAIGAGDCAPDESDSLDVALELVYGHCWGRGGAGSAGEVRIDPARITRRKR